MDTAAIVHLVDDDPSIRSSLSRLLRTQGYGTRCYTSAGDFLFASHPDVPSCIVLDISMPGPSGLDLQEALAKRECAMPIVFLTGHGDIPKSVRAMKAGAVDFLTKPVRASALFAAVATALTRDHEQRTAEARRHALLLRYERLTSRERQVFFQVTDGKLNKQVANELHISERTIKAHRAQVMEKMAVRSLAELVRAADKIRGEPRAVTAPTEI